MDSQKQGGDELLPVSGHLGGRELMVKPTFSGSVFCVLKGNREMLGELLFVCLNVADGYLTKVAIDAGFGIEGNLSPVTQAFGSNVLAKTLLSVLVILFLRWVDKNWCLWLANLSMFGVVVWNAAVCFAMAMISLTPRVVTAF